MGSADADVLHDDVGDVVSADEDLLVLLQADYVAVEFLLVVLYLVVLKFSIGGLEGGEIQERVGLALVGEFVGELVLA